MEITQKEIIDSIVAKDSFYEKHIFCVENVVALTIKYLAEKGFFEIIRNKKTFVKNPKVEVFGK